MTFRDRLNAIVGWKVEEARTARLVAAFGNCGKATMETNRTAADFAVGQTVTCRARPGQTGIVRTVDPEADLIQVQWGASRYLDDYSVVDGNIALLEIMS